MSTGVFIAGSCVSRDTVELMDHERYALRAYVARQSLISAYGSPAQAPDLPAELSPFQRRMVQGDVAGDLPRRLRRSADLVDLVLWDLFDERLGVYALTSGGYVTRTPEIMGTTLHAHLEATARLVALGSEEHLRSWCAAATGWHDLLDELGLADRTLLVAPPWATRSSSGSPVPGSFGLGPEEANRRYAPYLIHVASLGVPVLTVPEHLAVAAADHRWGLAPFHYQPATYQCLISLIEDASTGFAPQPT